MKTINTLLLATTTLFVCVAFSACENKTAIAEEEMPEVSVATPCVLTVEAVMTKALADAGTTLTATWEVNDPVDVYNSSETKLGTIRATSAGASTTLTGTLDSSPTLGDVLTLKFRAPSYSTQDGTLDYIANNCDYAVATVTVVEANVDYGTAVTSKANFLNQQAVVKFTLKNKSGSADLPVSELKINDGTNTYTITPASAANVLYVALPAISYVTLTLVADTEKYGLVRTGVSFERGQFYTRTLKMHPYFSVAADKKVLFSPGNLQATYNAAGKTWSWDFAANQYDVIGNNSGNITITSYGKETTAPYTSRLSADGTVDLFSLSTSYSYYGITQSKTQENFSGAFIDWGELEIGSYPANYWRTPSSEEWTYLISTRDASTINETSNARYVKAQVNGVSGILLFPDTFVWNTTTFGDYPTTCNTGNAYYNATIISSEQWTSLEAVGCVFLPSGGYRSGNSYATSCTYSSSTKYGSYHGYFLTANPVSVATPGLQGYVGKSVRLAHEL